MRKKTTTQTFFRSILTMVLIVAFSAVKAQTDAGVSAIVSPTSPTCAGFNSIKVVVHNYGATGITSALVNWTVNGVAQSPYSYNGLLFPGENDSVIIGLYPFNYGSYNIVAHTVFPNGQGDADPSNDTASVIVSTMMSGAPLIDTAHH